MAKTKTRDEVMSEFYWTLKEKEDMNSKYSTNLLKENCNQEELSDKNAGASFYRGRPKLTGGVCVMPALQEFAAKKLERRVNLLKFNQKRQELLAAAKKK